MIEVKNVTKIYKMGKETVVALNNVSLNIDKGEFYAFGSALLALVNLQ